VPAAPRAHQHQLGGDADLAQQRDGQRRLVLAVAERAASTCVTLYGL
jgi:hypothetical protein